MPPTNKLHLDAQRLSCGRTFCPWAALLHASVGSWTVGVYRRFFCNAVFQIIIQGFWLWHSDLDPQQASMWAELRHRRQRHLWLRMSILNSLWMTFFKPCSVLIPCDGSSVTKTDIKRVTDTVFNWKNYLLKPVLTLFISNKIEQVVISRKKNHGLSCGYAIQY